MKTTFITLRITCDDTYKDPPQMWAWAELIDIGPDESVEVAPTRAHVQAVLDAVKTLMSDEGENPEYDRGLIELAALLTSDRIAKNQLRSLQSEIDGESMSNASRSER